MTQLIKNAREIARKIDHTLLRPTFTEKEFELLCSEALQYSFKTVCIPPAWVKKAVSLLKGSEVGTVTVVGFPLGYSKTEIKAREAELAIEEGASEIDMVINLTFLKSKMFQEMGEDIRTVKKACGIIPLKVILETAYLNESEKREAAKIAEFAGADFLKTSTGFASGVEQSGASLADIVLLRKTLKPGTKIKASGGIRDLEFALSLIEAGADRLGTSSGVKILNGLTAEGKY